MIPTIAATARTEPATAPAIAPPLINFMSTPEEDVEGVAAAAVTVAGGAFVSEVVMLEDEELEIEVVDAACPKGVATGFVVVRTFLLYPAVAAQPYP